MTHLAHCVERSHSFFFLIFFLFPNDDKVKQLPVATVRKFDFFPVAFFAGKLKNVFDYFQPINIANAFVFPPRDRSLNMKLLRVLDSKSNTHPSFIKAKPHYLQQSPCLAMSTGGIVAFGSP